MRNKARILIVDDHPLVRRGLAEAVEEQQDMEPCGQASGAAEALQLINETKPDLVILDLSLQEGSGIDLIKQIKSFCPQVKILISSMHDESLYGERCVRTGAEGYISKQEPVDNLIDAVRRILKNEIFLSDNLSQRMLHKITGADKEPVYTGVENLSTRQLEVFRLIGEGLSTRQIAERLNLSVKTIESHRENIRNKLSLESGSELTRRAVQWILEEQTAHQ